MTTPAVGSLRVYIGGVEVASDVKGWTTRWFYKSQVQGELKIDYDVEDDKYYTYIMYDISVDHLHFLKNNMSGNDGKDVITLPYRSPNPPSGRHVYVIECYQQQDLIRVLYDNRKFTAEDRLNYINTNKLKLMATANFQVQPDQLDLSTNNSQFSSAVMLPAAASQVSQNQVNNYDNKNNYNQVNQTNYNNQVSQNQVNQNNYNQANNNVYTNDPPSAPKNTPVDPSKDPPGDMKSPKDSWFKSGELSEGQMKHCRCILEVQSKGGAYNPYAVCARTGEYIHECASHYDWNALPEEDLRAYADLNKIDSSGTRNDVYNRIMQWKAASGK
ncbi:MAG: hypothetical protein Solumvirus1_46 [Solumvirus sp.]|uniref:Uncharacterized protein n=1 Tax=Solumvirus sp. TaxID=2487773 RepID=A0A3G5AIP0_9VIRU|nr:MAG: hypothetical protein Solumvirus1_46 [Solumvirus sp.]